MNGNTNSLVLTYEEKLQLMPTVAKLLVIASKIRREGMLSVEDEIHSQDDQFFKVLYNLFCGGYNPYVLRSIYNNFLNSSRLSESNLEYSKKFIQSEVLLLLQDSGQADYFLNFYCFSFFGFDFSEDYKTNMKIHLPTQLYNQIFSSYTKESFGLWD